jgi:hypothetical protein
VCVGSSEFCGDTPSHAIVLRTVAEFAAFFRRLFGNKCVPVDRCARVSA